MTSEYPTDIAQQRRVTHLTEQLHQAESEHTDFVNEILEAAPEAYDGDESAESIALMYVRDLEAFRDEALATLHKLHERLHEPHDKAMNTVADFIERKYLELAACVRSATPEERDLVHDCIPDFRPCGPGCPVFDVVSAFRTEYDEAQHVHVPLMALSDKLLSQIVRTLLQRGVIYR